MLVSYESTWCGVWQAAIPFPKELDVADLGTRGSNGTSIHENPNKQLLQGKHWQYKATSQHHDCHSISQELYHGTSWNSIDTKCQGQSATQYNASIFVIFWYFCFRWIWWNHLIRCNSIAKAPSPEQHTLAIVSAPQDAGRSLWTWDLLWLAGRHTL